MTVCLSNHHKRIKLCLACFQDHCIYLNSLTFISHNAGSDVQERDEGPRNIMG
ncbi:hypothetical protein ACRRTK_001191 [Alexandromys fortis]